MANPRGANRYSGRLPCMVFEVKVRRYLLGMVPVSGSFVVSEFDRTEHSHRGINLFPRSPPFGQRTVWWGCWKVREFRLELASGAVEVEPPRHLFFCASSFFRVRPFFDVRVTALLRRAPFPVSSSVERTEQTRLGRVLVRLDFPHPTASQPLIIIRVGCGCAEATPFAPALTSGLTIRAAGAIMRIDPFTKIQRAFEGTVLSRSFLDRRSTLIRPQLLIAEKSKRPPCRRPTEKSGCRVFTSGGVTSIASGHNPPCARRGASLRFEGCARKYHSTKTALAMNSTAIVSFSGMRSERPMRAISSRVGIWTNQSLATEIG